MGGEETGEERVEVLRGAEDTSNAICLQLGTDLFMPPRVQGRCGMDAVSRLDLTAEPHIIIIISTQSEFGRFSYIKKKNSPTMTHDRGRVKEEIGGKKSSEEKRGGDLNDCKCILNLKIHECGEVR